MFTTTCTSINGVRTKVDSMLIISPLIRSNQQYHTVRTALLYAPLLDVYIEKMKRVGTSCIIQRYFNVVDVSIKHTRQRKVNERMNYLSVYKSTVRSFSSSRKAGKNPFENTFGLTFSISPEKAMEKFIHWAQKEQGLNTFLLNPTSVRIVATYCPVWSFDLNMRFVLTDKKTGRKRLDWKPEIFQVYGTQSVIHLPGLSAYAGYSYRRSLIDPLHNTALVFLGDKVVLFGSWMLRDMTMSTTGEIIPVMPDPWNAPQGRAFAVVKEGLESLSGSSDDDVRLQAEIVSSRRVYMPTYALNYSIFGMEYVCFQ
jgi:hypothetical protein